MGDGAATYFLQISERFASEAPELPRTWHFDAAADNDVLRELEALGLVERIFGTPQGFAWRLTEAGLREVESRVALRAATSV